MTGFVDSAGRALLEVAVRRTQDASAASISAWIDTGFTGELVLPRTVIDQLDLTQSGTVRAVLADGSQVAMKAYECYIIWFDELRRLEVVANNGDFPLLGVGLLQGHDLRIDYRSKAITLA